MGRVIARLRTAALIALGIVALWVGWGALSPRDAAAQEDVFIEPGERAEELEAPEGADLDRPLELDVAFEALDVVREGGDISVAYEVAASDWEMLADQNVTLWVSMWLPNNTTPITFAYSYHLPLDERSGVAKFPEWLSTLSVDEVGLCMLGTRPYDNLGLGRGYACETLHMMEVQDQADQTGEDVLIELVYYGGMPYYGYFPWRGPFL